MSAPPNPLAQTDIFRALSLLRPYDITSAGKIRIGPNRDGGYVMLDDMSKSSDVLSFGISSQVEFDEDMANRGKKVFMYDHTIDGLPYERPEFMFRKLGIGPVNDESQYLRTLEYHMRADNLISRDDLLLKVDVEGAEYDSILATSDEILVKFRQIVIELHDLSRLDEVAFCQRFIDFMTKLLRNFHIFHVHGNNCRPIYIKQSFMLVDVLEISLVRSDIVQVCPSETIYPTPLDFANAHWAEDYLLWFFPFLPFSQPNIEHYAASLAQSEAGLRLYGEEFYGTLAKTHKAESERFDQLSQIYKNRP